MTKCNKWFITPLLTQLNAGTLPSRYISAISMKGGRDYVIQYACVSMKYGQIVSRYAYGKQVPHTVLAKSLERLEKKNITVTVFTLLFFSGFYTAIA